MSKITIKEKYILIVTILVWMPPAVRAQSDCSFSVSQFDVGRLTQSTDYEVFNRTGLFSDITIKLTRNEHEDLPFEDLVAEGSGGLSGSGRASQSGLRLLKNTSPTGDYQCRPELTIKHAGSLSGKGDQLIYRLISRSVKQDAFNGKVILYDSAFTVGEERRYQIDVQIPAYQFVESGIYSGDFHASVVANSNNLQEEVDTLTVNDRASVRLSVNVPSTARVSLAGTQQRRQIIDFGSLEVGKRPEMPVALTVQSTASYQLRIQSENGGQLVREGGNKAGGIPYETIVDNQRVALDAGSETIISRPRTGGAGDSIPLSFRIIDVREKRAGQYSDRVTISVIPAITEY